MNSPQEKINALTDNDDKSICQGAYNYLMSTDDSSYKYYLNKREELLSNNESPNIFEIYRWTGIECALWPHLYPFTSWCDTFQEGQGARKSSKIPFLTKCFSPIIDYCKNFELLHFVFDRWIYKTVTGAINSSRIFSPSNSLLSSKKHKTIAKIVQPLVDLLQPFDRDYDGPVTRRQSKAFVKQLISFNDEEMNFIDKATEIGGQEKTIIK